MKLLQLFISLSLVLTSQAVLSIGLKKGTKAPAIKTTDINGQVFDLHKSVPTGPVVLVFYRGGWCPYCNLQIRNLQKKVIPHLKKYKAQMVAISVDSVDEALKTKNKETLDMTVLSDSDANILKSYKVDYKVPESLVKTYKEKYKIDLERSSGKKHHIIAIPAVYVIDQKSTIHFSYANEDYKVRAQVKDILGALRKL